jgi:hypothetical protein
MLLREAINSNKFKASVEGLKALEAAEVRRYSVCLQQTLILQLHVSEHVHVRDSFNCVISCLSLNTYAIIRMNRVETPCYKYILLVLSGHLHASIQSGQHERKRTVKLHFACD